MLIADPGAVRHYPQLALQDDVESHAYGEAIDGGDERLFQVHVLRLPAPAPAEQGIIRVLVWRTPALRLILRQELDVAPGAETLPGSGDDADVDVGIEADVAPAGAHLRVRVRVKGVANLGPIERDIRDVALLFVDDVLQLARHRGWVVRRVVARHRFLLPAVRSRDCELDIHLESAKWRVDRIRKSNRARPCRTQRRVG